MDNIAAAAAHLARVIARQPPASRLIAAVPPAQPLAPVAARVCAGVDSS